jgi:hypothetical protein
MDHGVRPKVVLTDVPAHTTQLVRGSRVPNGNIGEDILGVVSVHVIVAASDTDKVGGKPDGNDWLATTSPVQTHRSPISGLK